MMELDTYTLETYSPSGVQLNEGAVVRAARRNAVFLIQNGTRRVFPNADSFARYGKSFNEVISLSEWDIFAIPIGRPIDP